MIRSQKTFTTVLFAASCALAMAGSAWADTVMRPVPPTAASRSVTIFDNGNIDAVGNQPTRPTVFEVGRPVTIVRIMTYHWNNAAGTGRPGTIGLLSDTGYWYGPWRAVGQPGQGGVPNAYWVATPNQALPTGTYRVIDSDPSSWSQNGGSYGAGIASVDARRR